MPEVASVSPSRGAARWFESEEGMLVACRLSERDTAWMDRLANAEETTGLGNSLSETIASALATEPAALPLLQCCAEQLWEQRDPAAKQLTCAA